MKVVGSTVVVTVVAVQVNRCFFFFTSYKTQKGISSPSLRRQFIVNELAGNIAATVWMDGRNNTVLHTAPIVA